MVIFSKMGVGGCVGRDSPSENASFDVLLDRGEA